MVPSGKQPHNYGKSPFFIGKSTINSHKWHFSTANYASLPEAKCPNFKHHPTKKGI
jgi:hypothetical protein